MKKIIWLPVIIFQIIFLSFAYALPQTDVIYVEKSGGGPNGFNNVIERHFYNPQTGLYHHELYCYGQGNTACTWTTPPSIMRLIPYAEDQIMHGILNGKYEEYFEGKKHVVEWDATDIYNAKITESVYEAGSN